MTTPTPPTDEIGGNLRDANDCLLRAVTTWQTLPAGALPHTLADLIMAVQHLTMAVAEHVIDGRIRDAVEAAVAAPEGGADRG